MASLGPRLGPTWSPRSDRPDGWGARPGTMRACQRLLGRPSIRPCATPPRRRTGSTARTARAAAPLDGTPATDLVSSAAASPGCGPRSWPRSATPPRRRAARGRPGRLGGVGRNGGFCAASLTHGLANGARPLPRRDRPARPSSAARTSTSSRPRSTATASTATSSAPASSPSPPSRTRWRGCTSSRPRTPGSRSSTATRCAPRSTRPPTSPASSGRDGAALVDPARLAWGLRRAPRVARRAGRRAHAGPGARAAAPASTSGPHAGARVRAAPRRARHQRVPAAGPPAPAAHGAGLRLRADDRAADARAARLDRLARRQGIGDSANQFHYYRLTDDNRILWGGYDAVYYSGATCAPRSTSGRRRSSCWPGTSSRRSRSSTACGSPTAGAARSTPAPGSAPSSARRTAAGGLRGRLHGARRRRDPLRRRRDARPARRRRTERTRLGWSARKPLPFPPEPIAGSGIELTRRALAEADRHDGRRNVWLRTLDRLGLGFDS